MSITGRLPKFERSAVPEDPFFIIPSGESTTLGHFIGYGLTLPTDFPAGYYGPTDSKDPRFAECQRRHAARERSRAASADSPRHNQRKETST